MIDLSSLAVISGTAAITYTSCLLGPSHDYYSLFTLHSTWYLCHTHARTLAIPSELGMPVFVLCG